MQKCSQRFSDVLVEKVVGRHEAPTWGNTASCLHTSDRHTEKAGRSNLCMLHDICVYMLAVYKRECIDVCWKKSRCGFFSGPTSQCTCTCATACPCGLKTILTSKYHTV